MTQNLELICRELDLTQYLDAFVDQGFDTWDTVLDIQESDLDALGVKLGHRRKLQRRIANARGAAHNFSPASSVKVAFEKGKLNGMQRDSSRAEGSIDGTSVTKRKYRRHPKPDENAPERPLSAYVLFSNTMREEVKYRKLTFTEIAKLVGECWQSPNSTKKETYESQANAARQKYNLDLAEYKKTTEYGTYANYLQDFKKRQARHSQGHDCVKRPKLVRPRLRHGSTSSSNASLSHANRVGSRSSSEMVQGSEAPITRQLGANPTTSTRELSSIITSPRLLTFDTSSPKQSGHRHFRNPSFRRERTMWGETTHQTLPSLSDTSNDSKTGIAPSTGALGGNPCATDFVTANLRLPVPDGTSIIPTGRSRPLLRHGPSSYSNSGSASSTASIGRMLGVGPLPVHAFLSHRATARLSPPLEKQPPPLVATTTNKTPTEQVSHGLRIYGFKTSLPAVQDMRNMRVEQSGEGDVLVTLVTPVPTNHKGGGRDGFDGMSALLRASEIIGRHNCN